MDKKPDDIVDAIDQLVDGQLAGGEPESGFNFDDPTYPKCPHCDRHWHGLPLTAWVATMYLAGVYPPDYDAARDDSPVVCQGSDFIGPMPHDDIPRSRAALRGEVIRDISGMMTEMERELRISDDWLRESTAKVLRSNLRARRLQFGIIVMQLLFMLLLTQQPWVNVIYIFFIGLEMRAIIRLRKSRATLLDQCDEHGS